MSFQGKVSGRVEVNLQLRIIAPECLGSGRHEKRIVPSPHCQQRWPMLSEVGLELGIESDVAGVVEKQIELCLMRSGAGQIIIIQRAAIGRYRRGVCDTMGVLKEGRFGRKEAP